MKHCPLCNSDKIKPNVGINNSFGQKNAISFCNSCELYFFSDMPSHCELNKFYSQTYFDELSIDNIQYKLKSYFSEIRAKSQLAYISSFLAKSTPASVIECGSADGTFLNLFKRQNWQIKGFELSETMRSNAIKKFNIKLDASNFLDFKPAKKVGVIAFPHVLEHLIEPAEYLRHAARNLSEDGLIFLEFPYSPNPSEVDNTTLNNYFGTTHLYDFTEKSTKRLVLESGLELIDITRFKYPTPLCNKKTERLIGDALLTGDVSKLNSKELVLLCLSLAKMVASKNSKKGAFNKVDIGDEWRGRGDNIRVLAKIASNY